MTCFHWTCVEHIEDGFSQCITLKVHALLRMGSACHAEARRGQVGRKSPMPEATGATLASVTFDLGICRCPAMHYWQLIVRNSAQSGHTSLQCSPHVECELHSCIALLDGVIIRFILHVIWFGRQSLVGCTTQT